MFTLLIVSESQAARRALLIGISDYLALPADSPTGIADLRGPLNDLKAFKKLLISNYGFHGKDIKTLKNKEATRYSIEEKFKYWLVEGTERGDTAVLYFTGHGSRVEDQNGDEDDGYDEVICPYDMVPKGGKNIILDDELGQWLEMLKGRNVVVIADSCNAGGVMRGVGDVNIMLEATPARRSRFIPITGYQPAINTRGIYQGPDIPDHVVFMAASREDEVALEIRMPDGFHGGFSYGFCEGMKHLTKSII